jgi:ADP-ribose pyrophosphatase YjhB (NUDIX family)
MTEKICTLLLLKRGDQILLAMKKRGFGAGRWNGVGGKVTANETLEQALVRECREEIDVIPMNYWKVAEHDFHEFHDGEPSHMYVHTYMCDEWERSPIESEEMRPQWFDITDIPYAEMWPDDEFWLPLVVAGEKVVSTFRLDQDDKIVSHEVNVVDSLPDTIPSTS